MAKDQNCRRCGGTGYVRCGRCHGAGTVGKDNKLCPACGTGLFDVFRGSGRLKCDACRGTGKYRPR